jgi:protein involved in temperature-dependent protein secretion
MDQAQIIEQIKNRPTLFEFVGERTVEDAIEDARQRYADGRTELAFNLFELYVLAGVLEEADAVLGEFRDAVPELGKTCAIYGQLLEAERWRLEWHANGERVPAAFTKPPGYLRLRCRAWHEYHQRTVKHAIDTLRLAERERPAVSGVLESPDGRTRRFDDVRDSDCFVCDVLEILTPGKFFMVPWEQVRRIEFPQSEALRQSVFVLAKIVTFTQVQGLVWVPRFYGRTHFCEREESRSGAETTWEELDDVRSLAFGPRKLQFHAEDSLCLVGLDEITRIAFSPPKEEGEAG